MTRPEIRLFKESGGGISNATTGYFILCGIAILLYALATHDSMYLLFEVPILLMFALGSSVGKGTVEDSLETVGWSSRNLNKAVPAGIIGGLVCVILGGIITRFSIAQMGALVPDFTGISLTGASSVIPVSYAIGANILVQWFVIAPSEESLARILTPYAINKILKNWFVAFALAGLLWAAMHTPALMMQNASPSMYLVLLVIATVTTAVLLITGNIMSAIIVHGVYNTTISIMSSGIDNTGYMVLFALTAVLLFAWYKKSSKSKSRIRGGLRLV